MPPGPPASTGVAHPAAVAVQDDDRPLCPSCSAPNPTTSAFCWRCYGSLGRSPQGPAPAMRPPAPAGAGYGMGLPAPEETAPPTRQTESLGFKIVAAVAAALLGFFVWHTLFHHDGLSLPDSVAGMERIESPAMAPAVDQLRAQAKSLGVTGDAAIYGTGDTPAFLVLVLEGVPGSGQSPDAIFQGFATGFASSGSASLDHVRQGGDGTYTTYCARMRGSIPGGLCMWSDQQLVGFVLYPGQSVGSTETLTESVRTATES
jgi:hypothetical protein